MAFEKVEKDRGHECLLESVPDVRSEQIGGLGPQVDTLFSALTMALTDPERAARYGLGGRQSILMIGPPGCGKTLLAKAAANEVMRVSGTRCQIAVVRPTQFESPWVGQTQSNIRDFFKRLREAANEGYVVAFFDEIESAGRIRGSAAGHHSDKFLGSLLVELDGFTDRKNIAIISATNRKDLVDAALLERISDIEIPIGRPNLQAARAIFRIHLPVTMPYCPNGTQADSTREELIETAVSKFYSTNSDNEISLIRFRDGKQRTVLARELVSGRIFEQVCRQASRAACLRDLRGGSEPGLRVSDIRDAVEQAMQRMRTSLSVENAHS
jgi:proteasome-associated ATPase